MEASHHAGRESHASRRLIIVFAAGVLAAFVLAGIFFLSHQREHLNEPEYGGKRASEWVEALAYSSPNQRKNIHDAFRGMGPSVVPFLILILEKEETALNKFYTALHPKVQDGLDRANQTSNIKNRIPPPERLINQKIGATMALREMGTNATEAIPAMIQTLRTGHRNLQIFLVDSMIVLAPDTKYEQEVVGALIDLTSDLVLADKAYSGLGSFPNQSRMILPVLIDGLTKAPVPAMESLEQFGPKAQDAIPYLVELSKSDTTSSLIRTVASSAVAKIRRDEAIK